MTDDNPRPQVEVAMKIDFFESDEGVACRIDGKTECVADIRIPHGAIGDEMYRRDLTNAAWDRLGRMVISHVRQTIQTTKANTR